VARIYDNGMNFRLHKRREISSLAERLLASQIVS